VHTHTAEFEELRARLRAKRGRARALYAALPPTIKRRAKGLHHDVHPYGVLAARYPDLPEVAAYAELLLDISALEVALAGVLAQRAPEPNLRLGKTRRWPQS